MKNWVAVASADHVRIGRAAGFMQVNHGKAAPLRRIQPGDRVVYYSPTEKFKSAEKLQAFTAIGIVKAEEPYQSDAGEGFRPFRRGVNWLVAEQTPIRALLDRLTFTQRQNWGYQLRFGLFEISEADMALIATAMGATLTQS